jgi:hypothetical protein
MFIMNGQFYFLPPRRAGIIFQIGLVLLLGLVLILSVRQISADLPGQPLWVFFLLAGLSAGLIPLVLYRFQALRRAAYIIERDGVRLHWGLRSEDIPMDQVVWVGPAEHLERPLPLPRLRWPGYVLGKQSLQDGTPIEFFSARSKNLVLIATESCVYVISPEQREEFLLTFQRLVELGCLTPIPARSIYPSFFLARFWADLPARYLLISGAALSLFLLVLVSMIVSGRPDIDFNTARSAGGSSRFPSVQLFLLPGMNTAFFSMDALMALFFYRRAEVQTHPEDLNKPLAYLLLASGVSVPILFIGAVIFLI